MILNVLCVKSSLEMIIHHICVVIVNIIYVKKIEHIFIILEMVNVHCVKSNLENGQLEDYF